MNQLFKTDNNIAMGKVFLSRVVRRHDWRLHQRKLYWSHATPWSWFPVSNGQWIGLHSLNGPGASRRQRRQRFDIQINYWRKNQAQDFRFWLFKANDGQWHLLVEKWRQRYATLLFTWAAHVIRWASQIRYPRSSEEQHFVRHLRPWLPLLQLFDQRKTSVRRF